MFSNQTKIVAISEAQLLVLVILSADFIFCNCYNFPTHAQFLTTLLPIPAYMFRPLWAIIRAL
jgi:hypothetical protein